MPASDVKRVPAEFIEAATGFTRLSRPILQRYYRRRLDVAAKPDASPVTEADRACEAALRAAINERFPAHGILGEEFGAERLEAEFVWVLDPLDGTRAFVTGRPLFGTLIALVQGGRPVLGVIDMPILGDLFLGALGHETTLNGEAIRARPCAEIGQAYFSTVAPHIFRGAARSGYERIAAAAKSVTYGGDCYQYAMVAAGFLDLVVEMGLERYDYLALAPILAGAGAVIRDWQGRELDMQSKDKVVAAGDPRLLDQALGILDDA